MHIAFSPPDITEKEINEVVDTLKSGWITTGPKTKEFERRLAAFIGTSRVACLNSATACAEMILRILGIGEGDEVITSAYTYTASASVIAHVGAKIVLVDTAEDSYEMDYNKLEEAINERTKAIICVDIGGTVCDYDRVFEIVEQKKALFKASTDIQKKIGRVAVLADGAHALGAERDGVRCGKIADFTSFSFHAVKNLTTAEGGAATWKDIEGVDNDELYKQFMLLSLHGQSKDALAKTQLGAWEYDVVAPYFKCNMTDIMAAIGLAQLERYPGMLARRKQIIERYNDGFKDLDISVLDHYHDHMVSSGHLYLVRVNGCDRTAANRIIEKMAEAGIATNVHYKPLPLLTAYKNLGFRIEDYPNAYHMFENEITLPLHTKLTDEEVDYIIYYFRKIVLEQVAK
ncbi:capsular biosynthesis protein [Lachnoclostridium sp. An169]|uniref:DegT/DnrJ/EryC1/StrS family aminotransferase n=1 Tax=Lachnoclostridium sp. An169 TaxID=1965569 RepID=UPI000B37835A|nr:capsular biosynthesis protein [Lachnoclostridium sp. An169]